MQACSYTTQQYEYKTGWQPGGLNIVNTFPYTNWAANDWFTYSWCDETGKAAVKRAMDTYDDAGLPLTRIPLDSATCGAKMPHFKKQGTPNAYPNLRIPNPDVIHPILNVNDPLGIRYKHVESLITEDGMTQPQVAAAMALLLGAADTQAIRSRDKPDVPVTYTQKETWIVFIMNTGGQHSNTRPAVTTQYLQTSPEMFDRTGTVIHEAGHVWGIDHFIEGADGYSIVGGLGAGVATIMGENPSGAAEGSSSVTSYTSTYDHPASAQIDPATGGAATAGGDTFIPAAELSFLNDKYSFGWALHQPPQIVPWVGSTIFNDPNQKLRWGTTNITSTNTFPSGGTSPDTNVVGNFIGCGRLTIPDPANPSQNIEVIGTTLGNPNVASGVPRGSNLYWADNLDSDLIDAMPVVDFFSTSGLDIEDLTLRVLDPSNGYASLGAATNANSSPWAKWSATGGIADNLRGRPTRVGLSTTYDDDEIQFSSILLPLEPAYSNRETAKLAIAVGMASNTNHYSTLAEATDRRVLVDLWMERPRACDYTLDANGEKVFVAASFPCCDMKQHPLDVENDAVWLDSTEFVLVIQRDETRLEPVMYIGPQGGPAELTRYSVTASEALMGTVASGSVEVWGGMFSPLEIPESGILFANRWLLSDVNGGFGVLVDSPVYASDAVGTRSSKRQLHFVDDEVFSLPNVKICVGEESLLRACAEGETATPEEVTERLRVHLALVPGQHIAGSE